MDVLAYNQLLLAGELLKPGGEHAGKTFVIILINPNGSVAFTRQYTVSY